MVWSNHIGSMIRNMEMLRAKAVIFYQEFKGNATDDEFCNDLK